MKPKFIDYYMKIAETTAELSYAKRLQVGAVIVRQNQILATGYNGMPSGWNNDCEDKVWDKGAGGWLSPEEIEEQYPYEGWHEGAQRNVRYGLKTKPEILSSVADFPEDMLDTGATLGAIYPTDPGTWLGAGGRLMLYCWLARSISLALYAATAGSTVRTGCT